MLSTCRRRTHDDPGTAGPVVRYSSQVSTRVRQRTPEELLESARILLKRLTRSLDAFDAGEHDAIYDVAAQTRTALAFGNGDKTVIRLVNMHRLTEPALSVPAVGDLWGRVDLQIGPIPCEFGTPESRVVTLSKWMTTETAALIPGERVQTWDRFITYYANEGGAHVSTTMRAELDAMRLFQGPATTVTDYMMRAAGAVAERCLSDVLDQIEGTRKASRPYYTGGVRLGAITQNRHGEVGWDLQVDLHADAHVAAIPISGELLELDWVWDSATQTGSLRLNRGAVPLPDR